LFFLLGLNPYIKNENIGNCKHELILGGKTMIVLKHLLVSLFICALVTGCNLKDEGREDDHTGEESNRNFGALNAGHALGGPNFDFMNTTATNNNRNNNARLQVADQAEERVEKLGEVKHTNIIVRNRDAYVGVEMDDDFHGEVTPLIEDQISILVRETDSSIRNVYVSSNSEFVKQMGHYSSRIRSNRRETGLSEDFSKLVHRRFQHHNNR
jgi:YhcN/YlaJ family sporulation lipoprotein